MMTKLDLDKSRTIKVFTREYKAITLSVRWPTIKDYYGLSFDPPNATHSAVVMYSRLTGESMEVIESLTWDSLTRLGEIVATLMKDTPTIGLA